MGAAIPCRIIDRSVSGAGGARSKSISARPLGAAVFPWVAMRGQVHPTFPGWLAIVVSGDTACRHCRGGPPIPALGGGRGSSFQKRRYKNIDANLRPFNPHLVRYIDICNIQRDFEVAEAGRTFAFPDRGAGQCSWLQRHSGETRRTDRSEVHTPPHLWRRRCRAAFRRQKTRPRQTRAADGNCQWIDTAWPQSHARRTPGKSPRPFGKQAPSSICGETTFCFRALVSPGRARSASSSRCEFRKSRPRGVAVPTSDGIHYKDVVPNAG